MNQKKIRSVAIVGGGHVGWTVAAALSQGLQAQGVKVTVVQSDTGQAQAEAVSTLPNSVAFQQQHGMDERDLVRATRATFRLGTQFNGWWQEGHNHFQPLSRYGAGIGFLKFHNFYTKSQLQGTSVPLNEYSLCAAAAAENRFIHPVSDQDDVRSTLFYGLHMDTAWYQKYLEGFARYHGATALSTTLTDVEIRADDGFIESLKLGDGTRLAADLFIDCSGSQGQLIGKVMDVDWQDWSELFPVTRALTINLPPEQNPPPFTTIHGLDEGWLRDIPLQDRVVREFYFDEHALSEEQAVQKLRELSPTAGHLPPRSRSIVSGKRAKNWVKNCVAMGHSACSIEPLSLDSLHLAENQALRLLDLFPDRNCDPVIAHEFNRLSDQEFEQVKDFTLLHYLTSRREQKPFWNAKVSVPAPARIKDAIALFESRGELPYYDGDTFGAAQWAGVLYGSGNQPKAYNRHLDTLDWGLLQQRFDGFRATVREAMSHMPTHREYLLDYLRPG